MVLAILVGLLVVRRWLLWVPTIGGNCHDSTVNQTVIPLACENLANTGSEAEFPKHGTNKIFKVPGVLTHAIWGFRGDLVDL